MKGNKKILIIAVLLLLISVSFTTYAIYKTAVSGNATVTAAIWDVNFKNGETTLTSNYTLTLSTSECTSNNHVKDGVIAPGATCTKQITLDAGSSEVDVTYDVEVGNITAEKNSTAVATTGANTISATLLPASGTITYNNNTRTATLTLTVTWGGDDDSEANPADTKNNADTSLNGATITVPLTLVAKQAVGS